MNTQSIATNDWISLFISRDESEYRTIIYPRKYCEYLSKTILWSPGHTPLYFLIQSLTDSQKLIHHRGHRDKISGLLHRRRVSKRKLCALCTSVVKSFSMFVHYLSRSLFTRLTKPAASSSGVPAANCACSNNRLV